MTERPNKELALRYWSDPTLQAWCFDRSSQTWMPMSMPCFVENLDWHVGHEAPKEPPARMCELAGVKFPMPMREAPALGSAYWHAGTVGACRLTWRANSDDLRWLGQGVCHATKAAALEMWNTRASPWQPIETAPKDGTTVLLGASGRVTVGEWRAERWPTASEYHGTTGEYLGQHETGECIPAGWYSWDGGFSDDAPPTRWQPLPEPPKD